MLREKLQFEAFGKGKPKEQKVDKKEVQEKQAELQQKTISLAEAAKSAFAKDDLQTTLDKLRELQRAVLPESEIKPEMLEKLEKEFDRQVENLINKGYAKAAELSDGEFRGHLMPLREKIQEIIEKQKETEGVLTTEIEAQEGHYPFVIVVKKDLASLENQIPLMEVDGKKGYTPLDSDDLSKLEPVEGVKIPKSLVYLVVDIKDGRDIKNICPDDAIEQFKKQHRTGLTTEEGIALIVQHPEILKDHYIDLSGSRCRASSGVPGLGLGEGRPRLYWGSSDVASSRWGSASCGSRIGS